jgi:ubiquinone/menaquinone biosynthesis C-methylase UbiE
MMAVVHETLYELFRDPYEPLSVAGLEAGQRVLEVGCGPGFFTVPAAEMVGQSGSITSLDVSPTAVAHVRQKVEEAGVTNVEVLLRNAADTGLPGESFDLVFVFGLGHVVGDLENIWTELHRLLKPGGRFPAKDSSNPLKSSSAPLNTTRELLGSAGLDSSRHDTRVVPQRPKGQLPTLAVCRSMACTRFAQSLRP